MLARGACVLAAWVAGVGEVCAGTLVEEPLRLEIEAPADSDGVVASDVDLFPTMLALVPGFGAAHFAAGDGLRAGFWMGLEAVTLAVLLAIFVPEIRGSALGVARGIFDLTMASLATAAALNVVQAIDFVLFVRPWNEVTPPAQSSAAPPAPRAAGASFASLSP